jgi:hypothetical protein
MMPASTVTDEVFARRAESLNQEGLKEGLKNF